eukprot:scaffold13921_cov18-Tisochrysis_lutea.AAC.1
MKSLGTSHAIVMAGLENARKEERILKDLKMLVDRTMNATAAEKDAEAQQQSEEAARLEGAEKAAAAGS